MAKIISFFNHKGGVGKTTAIYNLAFSLAKRRIKTLTIDADPQMNLTAYLFGLSTTTQYSEEQLSQWRNFNEKYTSLEYILTQVIQKEELKLNLFSKKTRNCSNQVDLVKSSISLSSLEFDITDIIKRNNQLDYGIFPNIESYIRDNLGKEYDLILIDLSPSASSSINGILMLLSDYFIVPASPTLFSLQAIDNLSNVFKNWKNLLNKYSRTKTTKGLSFSPKFLGLLIVMAKRRAYKGKIHPTKATVFWKKFVNKSVYEFVKYAHDSSNTITAAEFKKIFPDKDPFIIDICYDFTNELRNMSEQKGLSIVEIKKEDKDFPKTTSKRKDEEGREIQINQFEESLNLIQKSYSTISKSLISLL